MYISDLDIINFFIKLKEKLSLAMPSNCTAYKCANNSDQGFALFRYPCDEKLKQKWVAAVGRGQDWSPSSSQKLCEIHFMPKDIEFVAKCKRVKAGAFPSRFCTCPLEDKENLRKKQSRNEPYQRKSSLTKRQGSIQHQCGCVQLCKPLTKEEIQNTVDQEIAEESDKLQLTIEHENSLQYFLDENKQLRK